MRGNEAKFLIQKIIKLATATCSGGYVILYLSSPVRGRSMYSVQCTVYTGPGTVRRYR